MNKLIRFYNQNRRTIWIVVFAVVLLIACISALNNISKMNSEKRAEVVKEINTGINEKDYIANPNIQVTISDDEVNENKNLIIDQFIRYCNAGQVQSAYALLSDSCKQYVYPTIELFNSSYVNKIFNTTRLYSKEHYTRQTYKVSFYEDIASTGKIIDTAIEDYYTITKNEDGNVRLNINNYIEEKTINKKSSNKNLEVSILNKRVFKEYEEYTLEVKNLTEKEIKIDSLESTRKLYLSKDSNFKYYCLLHEKTDNELIVFPKSTKKINLKFNMEYNSNNYANGITISDIILDNTEYEKLLNKTNYTNRGTISIEL